MSRKIIGATVATTMNLSGYATEKYVDEALAKVYRVTVTRGDDGKYVADKTFTEVFQAQMEQKAVQCVIELEGAAYILPLCSINSEPLCLIYGGSAGDTSLSVIHTIAENINVIAEDLATQAYVDNAIANFPTNSGLNMPELIASGTMEEEARGISITLDNNGQPFELIATVLLISNAKRAEAATANASCTCTFRGEGREANVGYAILEATVHSYKKITAVCNIMGVGYLIQGDGTAPSVGTPKMFGANNYCFPVTSVLFRHISASEKIGAGLTYELWGIRK